jgi:hypothetical protein
MISNRKTRSSRRHKSINETLMTLMIKLDTKAL